MERKKWKEKESLIDAPQTLGDINSGYEYEAGDGLIAEDINKILYNALRSEARVEKGLPEWRGEWTEDGEYGYKDIVKHYGETYIALEKSGNVNQVPATATGYWDVFVPRGSGDYISDFTFIERAGSNTARSIEIPRIDSLAQIEGKPIHIKTASAGRAASAVNFAVNGLPAKNIYFPSYSDGGISVAAPEGWVREGGIYTVVLADGKFVLLSMPSIAATKDYAGVVRLSGEINDSRADVAATVSAVCRLNEIKLDKAGGTIGGSLEIGGTLAAENVTAGKGLTVSGLTDTGTLKVGGGARIEGALDMTGQDVSSVGIIGADTVNAVHGIYAENVTAGKGLAVSGLTDTGTLKVGGGARIEGALDMTGQDVSSVGIIGADTVNAAHGTFAELKEGEARVYSPNNMPPALWEAGHTLLESKKLNIAQGANNAGKYLVVGADGDIAPALENTEKGIDISTVVFTESNSPGTNARTVSIVGIASFEEILNKPLFIKAAASGTSAPTTLNINNYGAKSIKFPMLAGDGLVDSAQQYWIKAGAVYNVVYTGAYFVLTNMQVRSATVNDFGLVKLNDTLTSTDASLALTAKQGNVLKGLIDALSASFLDRIYPVGSVYTSVVNTSPAALFGGSWTAMPAGRYPYSIDSGAGGITGGGGNVHTPAHYHTLNYSGRTDLSGAGSMGFMTHGDWNSDFSGYCSALGVERSIKSIGSGSTYGKRKVNIDAHTHGFTVNGTTSNTGINSPYLPAYFTVYMWRRNA